MGFFVELFIYLLLSKCEQCITALTQSKDLSQLAHHATVPYLTVQRKTTPVSILKLFYWKCSLFSPHLLGQTVACR